VVAGWRHKQSERSQVLVPCKGRRGKYDGSDHPKPWESAPNTLLLAKRKNSTYKKWFALNGGDGKITASGGREEEEGKNTEQE